MEKLKSLFSKQPNSPKSGIIYIIIFVKRASIPLKKNHIQRYTFQGEIILVISLFVK